MIRKRIPSLNWLRVFEAAASAQSFARAAEILNMSAPAVSQQIRALEDHLGRQLFERAPQKVLLTPAGTAFLPIVQQSLASVETTAAALFGGAEQKIITLQAVTLLAMSWLPRHIAEFERLYPGTRVNVITGETLTDFRTILPGREPDLQIAFGSVTDFGATAVPFLRETLCCVATPEIARGLKEPSDLGTTVLLEVAAHHSGWHQMLSGLAGIELRDMDFRMVDSTPLALMLASQGQGVALARSPASDEMVRALNLEYCFENQNIKGLQRYHIIEPEKGVLPRHVVEFKDWLVTR
ncbi:LysR family transcriptional regulator [Cochlodiniinecator piscidefendens]|uniref:LysR family transcriptional regulator n=1 Tax=Cochlodiniinecator piscidefendens TaxID=2715756 RepID=UPI00140852AE|nr:LysR family transcriptional regulator [Cochlodiniinecator piscidefendens]